MTFVKICGVSDPVTARAAAAFGADFVGVVFAPSRRQVTIGQAGRIAESLGQREHVSDDADAAEIEAALGRRRPLLVGVFADQDADTINDIAEGCGLDLVQLSGSEPWELNEDLRRPILKCLKLRPEETSTAHGWTSRTASPTLAGVSPPASMVGVWRATSAATDQSSVTPVPP